MFYRGFEHFGSYCSRFLGPGSGFFMNPWGIVIGALALIAVVVLVVVLVKVLKRKGGGSNVDEAIELLKSKYVAGEITEEEYLKKKKILGK